MYALSERLLVCRLFVARCTVSLHLHRFLSVQVFICMKSTAQKPCHIATVSQTFFKVV